ncbi:hypothetical protein [Terriglobus tenax]|uniref:hypothetical protein n=1 Tax=Terriglobus tenax TaxID=1111115 RepID=UPI0021DF99AC|nr:hypothetical protein [Terriglobus tenax]
MILLPNYGRLSFAQTVTTPGGSAGTIPKFTGSSTLENSAITESNGAVAVGAANPLNDFSINVGSGSGHGLIIGTPEGSWGKILAGAGQWAFNPLVKTGDTAFIFSNGGMDTGGYVLAPWTGNIIGLRMTNAGKVGIGTGDPAENLDVVGNIKISGTGAHLVFPNGETQSVPWNGTTCGGDYAESVDVAGDRKSYEPGDVLVIDSHHPGSFLKSAEPYATGVTGIFSTKPGLTGRRQLTPKSEDEVPMAMMGIVPTKVSAENGPIHPGDLLVSSSTPGYAMKGTDRSKMLGAVIGKALGELNKDTGVIEVVVTLQ